MKDDVMGDMMEDYKRLTADDLNDEGCLMLVCEICREAAADYIQARDNYRRKPGDNRAAANYRVKRNFFLSEYFYKLTGLNGRAVLEGLDRRGDVSWVRGYTQSTGSR